MIGRPTHFSAYVPASSVHSLHMTRMIHKAQHGCIARVISELVAQELQKNSSHYDDVRCFLEMNET